LCLRGELHTRDERFDRGERSANAYRIAQVLEEADGVLSTGELRRAAGFPIGKEQRAAYLKAVEELDTRLLLAKVFSPDDEDMQHALVSVRYADQVMAAEEMTREEALDQFLRTYLPNAVYAEPPLLAKHLLISEVELRAGFDRLVDAGQAAIDGRRYLWQVT
jgi:hypothetical protein